MGRVKFIMRTTGDLDLSEYFKAIPGVIMCCDVDHNAMHTFKASLELAGDAPCVHMEDDIILCRDFVRRVEDEISKRPDDVIQFFSMRKDDLEIGSRYINGGSFCMGQCFYLPEGMSAELLEFMAGWGRYKEHPTGLDSPLMSDFFKVKKIKYWNVCPNLVDHKIGKSRIDPRRSSRRQSFTFEG
jgi:hypothetical protein